MAAIQTQGFLHPGVLHYQLLCAIELIGMANLKQVTWGTKGCGFRVVLASG
jgi:hypothetical protein